MGDNKKVLAIIPARGGSKRLPRKNILPLGGKPLIAWTIEAAIESQLASKVIVSSDDDEVLEIAARYGASPLKRSPELATDAAKTIDVVRDCIERETSLGNSYDDIILLQPTSPLRDCKDIIGLFDCYLAHNRNTVVSVCEVDHPIQWCGVIEESGELAGIDFSSSVRSQQLRMSYRINGAIYMFPSDLPVQKNTLYTKSVFAYVMPRDRSFDIDTAIDFDVCSAIVGRLS